MSRSEQGAFCWGGLSSLTFEDGSRVTGLGAGAFELQRWTVRP